MRAVTGSHGEIREEPKMVRAKEISGLHVEQKVTIDRPA
jgi:hypothetical protein